MRDSIPSNLWRSLRVGDRIRITAWPPELDEDRLHAETIEFYKWLIETKSVLTIVKLEDWGPYKAPWAEICRIVNGIEWWESIAINHGGFEVVAADDGH